MELHEFSSLSMLLTLLICMIFMVLRIRKKSKICTATLNLPPGPSKLPLIGNLHNLLGSLPHHRLRDLGKRHGPIMHLQLGEVTSFVISSPEIATEVMKTHDVMFAQRPPLLFAKILIYNCASIAFAPYGEYWRQLRKMCVLELLSAKRVKSFRSIREEEVSNFIGSLTSSAGLAINFSMMVNSLTYNIISRAAFGKIWKGRDVFIAAVKEGVEAAGGFSFADLYPSSKLLYVISGVRRELEKLYPQLDKLLESIIDEHIAKKPVENTGAEDEERDLVDFLLNLQDQGDLEFSLSIDNIKAVILDMFVAGSEASSTVVEWAMSEMVKNPRVMKKAQAEIRQVFGSQENVDETSLHKLNYLQLVIKETLRMHSPLPFLLPRENREKCKIAGYDIPFQSRIMVSVWGIGRDPKYWTEPERFYPERFLDSSPDYKGTDLKFMPFGAGRRMCPGILFGMANVELPLAQLLSHFDWELPNGLTDLDMSEDFGVVAKRKNNLCIIPIPHPSLP